MNCQLCGHAHHTNRCRACLKCEQPGHDPHVPQRCDCPGDEEASTTEPDTFDCVMCGRPIIRGELCGQCQRVVTR